MSAILAAPTAASAAAQPARLSGRWLRVARAAWWLLVGYPSLPVVLGLGSAGVLAGPPAAVSLS